MNKFRFVFSCNYSGICFLNGNIRINLKDRNKREAELIDTIEHEYLHKILNSFGIHLYKHHEIIYNLGFFRDNLY